MSNSWKKLDEETLKRLGEKIRRYCYYEHLENRKPNEDGSHRNRWPADGSRSTTAAAKSTYKAWKDVLRAAVADLKIDPFRHYLENLPPWDRKERIDHILDTVYEVTDDTSSDIAKWGRG